MSFVSFLAQACATLVAVNVTLALLASAGLKKATFIRRIIIAYINLSLCALFGVVASIVLTLVGHKRLSQWVVSQSFHYTMKYTAGVTCEVVSGRQYINTARPAVLVGNHQSALDILMLAAVWPRYCSVTAKKQLKNVPFLGWFMSLSGTVFLDRANKASALKAFESAATEMRDNRQSVFIFPEGTRSGATEPMLLPFKKGAFHLAVQAKAPILPVVTCVYSGIFSSKGWRFRSGKIPVVVLPPIPTDNLDSSDVDALTQQVREKMLEALSKLTLSQEGQQAFLADPTSTAGSSTLQNHPEPLAGQETGVVDKKHN